MNADFRIMQSSAQEEILMVRSAGGDKEASRSLVESHHPWVYALAFRVFQNPQAAFETTAAAFSQALKELTPLALQKSFSVLVVEKLIREINKRYKEGLPESSLTFDEELNLAVPVPRERRALLGMMVAAIKRLSLEERILLLLRDQAHFPCEEIAMMTGSSLPAVRKRLSETRLKMRKFLIQPLESNPTDFGDEV